MDVSAVLGQVLPMIPSLSKIALSHTLGLSENSRYWDLRTTLIVTVLRALMIDGRRVPITKTQRASMKAGEIKGRMWISKVLLPKPEEDSVRQALFSAIKSSVLPEDAPCWYAEPELLSVEAEWTGYRAGATENSKELRISEEQKYVEMMKEVSSPTTVLYFHGGAFYLMDPATHRGTCKKLAQLTRGRCLSVRYRLAPQNPFPAALLDALVSYLSLLYPPPGSLHTPVAPKHIVFAGDSAGGNLGLVLLQLVLELRRNGTKVTWNGEEREVPIPAGVAVCSPWGDITSSSPSFETKKRFDYLPPQSDAVHTTPNPPCEAWPTTPPRKQIYAEDGLLCHPLVSPIVAKTWQGSCPIYIGTGEELLSDEDRYIAQKAAQQGVEVVFEEYEAMPHCFAMILEHLPACKRFFDGWARFINQATESPEVIKTSGLKIRAKTLKEEVVDVKTLTDFTDEKVLKRMRDRIKYVLSPEQGDALAKL